MKRIIMTALICSAVLALFSCAEDKPTATGRMLVTETGMYVIMSDEIGDVSMSDGTDGGNIFDGFQTGDEIEITYSGVILESYPGQTTVYDCKLISRGTLADLPQDAYERLSEMGWKAAE